MPLTKFIRNLSLSLIKSRLVLILAIFAAVPCYANYLINVSGTFTKFFSTGSSPIFLDVPLNFSAEMELTSQSHSGGVRTYNGELNYFVISNSLVSRTLKPYEAEARIQHPPLPDGIIFAIQGFVPQEFEILALMFSKTAAVAGPQPLPDTADYYLQNIEIANSRMFMEDRVTGSSGFYRGLENFALTFSGNTPPPFTGPAPTPEPLTWITMVGGFGAIGFALRRGRKSRSDARSVFLPV